MGTLGGRQQCRQRHQQPAGSRGCERHSQRQTRAVLWRPGPGMQSLGTLGGDESRAFDINDATQVVGFSQTADGMTMPSSGPQAEAWRISAPWVARPVGRAASARPARSWASARRRRATWRRFSGPGGEACGALEPEGGEYLFATAYNTHRRVVGITFSGGEIEDLPFLWTSGSGMRLLPTLGGPLGQAQDLNEFGQIVGTTRTSLNDIRATLWTPIDGPLAVAPGGDRDDKANDRARRRRGDRRLRRMR